MSKQKGTENRKLTTNDKIAIIFSKKSSRELADEYGVHHSRICTIRLEAEAILEQEWDSRQPGRKANPKEPEKVTELSQQLEALQRDHELSQMRNDWLNLKMKLMAGHAADAGQEALFKQLEKKPTALNRTRSIGHDTRTQAPKPYTHRVPSGH